MNKSSVSDISNENKSENPSPTIESTPKNDSNKKAKRKSRIQNEPLDYDEQSSIVDKSENPSPAINKSTPKNNKNSKRKSKRKINQKSDTEDSSTIDYTVDNTEENIDTSTIQSIPKKIKLNHSENDQSETIQTAPENTEENNDNETTTNESEIDENTSQPDKVNNTESDEKSNNDTRKVKKLQSVRNKERRKRINRAIEGRRRAEKARRKALGRLDEINARLDTIYKNRSIRNEKLKATRLYREDYGTKRLGPEKFEKSEIDVLLPYELPSRLSRVSYQSLFMDRLQSLRKRNIIETRNVKYRVRRYRMKYQERYDYKVFNREQEQQYANLGQE